MRDKHCIFKFLSHSCVRMVLFLELTICPDLQGDVVVLKTVALDLRVQVLVTLVLPLVCAMLCPKGPPTPPVSPPSCLS